VLLFICQCFYNTAESKTREI